MPTSGLGNAALSQQDIEGIHRLLDEMIAVEEAELEQSKTATADSDNRFMAVLLWGTLAVFSRWPASGWALPRGTWRGQLTRSTRPMRATGKCSSATRPPSSYWTSRRGDLLDVNPAACAFYGYTREAMLHMNVTDLNTLQACRAGGE